MAGRWNLLILGLHLFFVAVLSQPSCPKGFQLQKGKCVDVDECAVDEDDPDYIGPCGEYAHCFNTNGSYYCQCLDGFRSSRGTVNFSAETFARCMDINECVENPDPCGPNAKCFNAIPHYFCICDEGFISSSGVGRFQQGESVTCKDICMIDKTICGNGTCYHGASGHYCACHAGFTNYANSRSRCTELNCDVYKDMKTAFPAAHHLVMELTKSCLELTESQNPTKLAGDHMLETLLSTTDEFLSDGAIKNNIQVSNFLDLAENALRLIGPFVTPPGTTSSSSHTELVLQAYNGTDVPKGPVTLSSEQAKLDIQLETAAGDLSVYPGFTMVSLLIYTNLEDSANGYFSGMKPNESQGFMINSKVVTVTVSNRNTSHLEKPVTLTLNHLKQSNDTGICAFWDSSKNGGTWSADGCSVVQSNHEHTVCSLNHLGSFAVLVTAYDIEAMLELKDLALITVVGLSLSLICLSACILTFWFIVSIQNPRTTILLNLCACLFIASLTFVARISRTESRVGCAVVAGLLHFFFLAALCWTCVEAVQLSRMVILGFNANFKTLYMMAGGYGVPAAIVGISALYNPNGYGTERYCWLKQELIAAFLIPACCLLIVNIIVIIIAAVQLVRKFSSLDPDLDSLLKIRALAIASVAEACVLDTMCIFGWFQYAWGTTVTSYLFSIFCSLHGVLLFAIHCLFSKQVRDEYGHILSRLCARRKKSYPEVSYSGTACEHSGHVSLSHLRS